MKKRIKNGKNGNKGGGGEFAGTVLGMETTSPAPERKNTNNALLRNAEHETDENSKRSRHREFQFEK